MGACSFAVIALLQILSVNAFDASSKDVLNFSPVNGYDCVRQDFVHQSDNVPTLIHCANLCNTTRDCQAFKFSATYRSCRMFVFNRCSKNVRTCLCNRFDKIFIKSQPGLKPGALCPDDFGFNRCGTKYKVIYDITRWDVGMDRCSSESGLTIMAEPIDRDKLSYLIWLYDNRYRRPGDPMNFYLGGSQNQGSSEPGGGWHWSTCRIPIAREIWSPGQPDNARGVEHYACLWRPRVQGFGDCAMEVDASWETQVRGALCECAAPFE